MPALSEARREPADPAASSTGKAPADVGVYLHVPFCERVCPYCDFAVVAAPQLPPEREARYVEALLVELALRAPRYAGRSLASLYLGGGTPSLLRPESLARLVAAVRAAFPGAPAGPAPEVTLEINPSTVERSRLPAFCAAGVTRASVGVQSFQDETLRRLGRAHRGEEARRTLAACREAAFQALSLDLIAGAPGQGRADLAADLAAAVAAAPEHVSVYELTIEPGTPFAAARAQGRLPLPGDDEDEAVARLELVEARLEAAGLRRYEISSYARPGREAVHNRRYWQRRPVLGLGVGAVSSEPPRPDAPHGARHHNPRQLAPYLEAAARARAGSGGAWEEAAARARAGSGAIWEAGSREVLDPATARGEAVFLALRQLRGLDAGAFEAEFGGPPRAFFAAAIERLVAAGLLLEAPGGDLRLSPRGRLLSDGVFAEFV